ncbi:unnamed protein product [Linum tenue]|uniref:RING-type domain-containing protein n=1 Tax=Linum tenue TaxID=586396 RepID=A0AAV0KQW0_9ROSI|nr:unnamed protein product [Linum tenue]
MGFFAEDSGLIVTHLLYKAALVLALLRCALSWALKLWPTAASPPSRRRPSPQQIRDRLIRTTFADVLERRDQDETAASCAVCLNQMSPEDEEEEGDESNHRTCPLCRTPLLTAAQSAAWSAAAEQQQQPSWAVERILYLFGDDLLVS